jgi:hypothetical protein
MPLLKKPPEIVLRSDAPFGAGAAATAGRTSATLELDSRQII